MYNYEKDSPSKLSCSFNGFIIVRQLLRFKEIIIIGLIGGISSLFTCVFKIRICLFYNLFKVPCPGCGLTRSFLSIICFDFISAFQFNILGIPLFIFLLIYFILILFNKKESLDSFFKNNIKLVIAICVMLAIISEIYNLFFNELL